MARWPADSSSGTTRCQYQPSPPAPGTSTKVMGGGTSAGTRTHRRQHHPGSGQRRVTCTTVGRGPANSPRRRGRRRGARSRGSSDCGAAHVPSSPGCWTATNTEPSLVVDDRAAGLGAGRHGQELLHAAALGAGDGHLEQAVAVARSRSAGRRWRSTGCPRCRRRRCRGTRSARPDRCSHRSRCRPRPRRRR